MKQSKRPFYRTVFTVTVLSEEPIGPLSLSEIADGRSGPDSGKGEFWRHSGKARTMKTWRSSKPRLTNWKRTPFDPCCAAGRGR